MVKNNIDVSGPQAEVLKGISEFLTIKEISKYRKTSRVAVYKIIKSLMKKGLLEKKDRGVYGLTNSGKEGLHSFIGLTHKLRQHNLSIKVEILESTKNWDKRREQIITMPYFNKRVKLRNNSYDLMRFGKMGLKITSKSVIFRLPTIYSESVDDCIVQAMDLLFQSISRVEDLLKIKLVKDYKSNITIISQEYARLNDSLAKLYRKEGNKIYITGDEGKVWLIADYSFSTDELETIDPNRADEDMVTVHAFMNDLRKNPTTFSEVREVIVQEANVMSGIQQNQLLYAENIKAHVQAIKALGAGVKKQNKIMEEISKFLKEVKK
jgi:DNA-binding PadR family transcriptional regulator